MARHMATRLTGCAVVLSIVGMAHGQSSVSDLAGIIHSQTSAEERFGRSIDVNGDYMAVGVPNDDQQGSDAGAILVLAGQNDEWDEEITLYSSEAEPGEKLGWSVVMGPNIVIASAPFRTGGGAVYVFTREPAGESPVWVQNARIDAPADSERFGFRVDYHDGRIIVGDPLADGAGNNAGAAYIYHRTGPSTWVLESSLTHPAISQGDGFGHDVTLFDTHAVVGSYLDRINENGTGVRTGAAYAFERMDSFSEPWVFTQRLTASDGSSFDRFGNRVDMLDSLLLVGSDRNDALGADSGAVYAFSFDGSSWSEDQKLTAWDGAAGDTFGFSVALSSTVLGRGDSPNALAIITSFLADANGENSGAAYVFEAYIDGGGAAWSPSAKLLPADNAAHDHFGVDVGFNDQTVAIGADLSDTAGTNAGQVYVFGVNLDDCDGNSMLDFRDIADGTHADVDSNGIPDTCLPPEDCPVDWNMDGLVNSEDFFAFTNDFLAANADFNNDGMTNSDDFFDYINEFTNSLGCE